MTSIEDKVKERIREAEQKDLFTKAKRVVMYLGRLVTLKTQDIDFAGMQNPEYEDNVMGIYGSFMSSYTEVVSEGREVFGAFSSREIRAYIPGAWENHLEELYSKALQVDKNIYHQVNEREDQRKHKKDEDDLKKKFGL